MILTGGINVKQAQLPNGQPAWRVVTDGCLPVVGTSEADAKMLFGYALDIVTGR